MADSRGGNGWILMSGRSEIPVFILCGGLGTRLKGETEFRPKPMVPVGNKPILWHIMRWYGKFGFRGFVLCLGYKADVIKSYFLNYTAMNSDFTVDLAADSFSVHSVNHNDGWKVTLAYTGEKAMTGARVARAAEKHLGQAEQFAVTYGDGLCDADLGAEFDFHLAHGKTGTVLAANPPSRFGQLHFKDELVYEFNEKPTFREDWINGGYLFFRRGFLDYLSTDDQCVLERTPLTGLARDGQLAVYKHSGFWACMDTPRDLEYLEGVWASGQAPWEA